MGDAAALRTSASLPRQMHYEAGTLTNCALHFHAAAVRFDDRANKT